MSNLAGMKVIVELDQNQRYWVGKGFGNGGLLPTDRGAFSTRDGSISYKSMRTASQDSLLLGRGWAWETDDSDEENMFQPSNQLPSNGGGTSSETRSNNDNDSGWLYAADFTERRLAQAKPGKSAGSFVRFRRFNRMKVFIPEAFVSPLICEQCDHCDSTALDALSMHLLEVLAYCTLLYNKSKHTDAITLPLKKKVIDIAAEYQSDTPDAIYNLDQLRRKIEMVVEKERSITAMSRMISGLDFSYVGRRGRKEFSDRCQDISSGCLPKEERDAIAGLLVRKLDPQFQLHCEKKACGGQCKFIRVACPNKGCNLSLSKQYMDLHHNVCPHKIIECDCGEKFPQHEWQHHLSELCIYREVACPFVHLGCKAVMKASELECHLAKETSAHLIFAVNRISEQDDIIDGIQHKIKALEMEHGSLSDRFTISQTNGQPNSTS